MIKKSKKIHSSSVANQQQSRITLFIIFFAIFAGMILVTIHAASPNTSLEPENDTASGNSCENSDSAASGGTYVQFGCNRTIVNVPTSIASDCSKDVKADLNTWLTSLPNNTTAVFKKDACYLTEDQIEIADKRNFSLDGNGATFKRTLLKGSLPTGNHMHVKVTRSVDIEILDLKITGEKPDSDGYKVDSEAQHGFGLYGVVNAVFDNVSISSIRGDCFYLNRGQIDGVSRQSEYVTIKNSYCHQTGRHGVAFLTASNILITNNVIENNHRENFDFEPYGLAQNGGVSNVTIDNNDIGPASQLMVSYSGGGPVNNFTFSNNRLHRPLGIDLEAGNNGPNRNFKIINNRVVDPEKINHGGAIQVHGVTGITISGNYAMFDSVNNLGVPNSYFAQFFYAHNINVSNNQAIGARTELNFDTHTDNYCGSGNEPDFTNLPSC